MHDLKLGQLVTTEQQRDAVHIAVIPVVAGEDLSPGEHVWFSYGKASKKSVDGHVVGVVDPFLRVPVPTGARFWLFLLPGTITSLRHEWSHPWFPSDSPGAVGNDREASELWLRQFASSYSIDYSELLEGAESGKGACFGSDSGPDAAKSSEFWQHIAIVTGKVFTGEHIENTFFRCSC